MRSIIGGVIALLAVSVSAAERTLEICEGSGTLPAPINMTEVHIPHLTTSQSFNQIIVISNKGKASTYKITFLPEMGTVATAGRDARGAISARKTKIISLRNDDVVRLEGRKRTAALLQMWGAPAEDFSVVTQQVNMTDGSTDSMVYAKVGERKPAQCDIKDWQWYKSFDDYYVFEGSATCYIDKMTIQVYDNEGIYRGQNYTYSDGPIFWHWIRLLKGPHTCVTIKYTIEEHKPD